MSLREHIAEAFVSCVRFQHALTEIAVMDDPERMRAAAAEALRDRNRTVPTQDHFDDLNKMVGTTR